MYLLYLDESGTHAGSPVLVLAGLAIHEQDAWHLQERLTAALSSALPPGLNPAEFELHATEIKSPIKIVRGKKIVSNWAQVPVRARFDVLRAAYRALGGFVALDTQYPYALFGAVVDRAYSDRERRAYEEVLHKFDEMLNRQGGPAGIHQRGIVIHDRRMVERDVQGWVDTWRHVAGRIGKLTHLTDVPMFSDSRASRLIQAADFIAWGLYRYYGDTKDETWVRPLWRHFDSANAVMHGLIHVVPGFPGFRKGACACPPCASRAAGPAKP